MLVEQALQNKYARDCLHLWLLLQGIQMTAFRLSGQQQLPAVPQLLAIFK